MGGLSAADVSALRSFIALSTFDEAISALERLIDCDFVAVDAIDFRRRQLLPECSWAWCTSPSYQDHWNLPIACARRRTGSFTSIAVRDVATKREIERSSYSEFGMSDELTVCLTPTITVRREVALGRYNGSFSDRDHVILDLLQPKLAMLAAVPRAALLTSREQEVLALVRSGRTNKEIASDLSIAPTTVRKHLENIFDKLGASTRTEAAAVAAPA